MPATPWAATGPVDPDSPYLVMATGFTVRTRFRMGGVISATRRLWSGISQVDGLVGWSLRADVARGRLATLTAWRDEASLDAFVRGEAHAATVAETTGWMRASAFARWSTPGAELPPGWADANRRLDASRGQRAASRESGA
jgi:quinol monooxygenase YgiN